MLNGYYGIETLLPDIIIQNLAFLVAVSTCCQKLLVTEIVGMTLDTTESASTWEIDVRYSSV